MKAQSHKPDGFQTVTPYLQVTGAARLLEFMKAAFHAEELEAYREPDGRLMHGRVRVGDSMVELADSNPKWPAMPAALHVYVPDIDEVHRRALAAGGQSMQEPTDQFYGERSSAVKDPCGNYWYIATLVEELSPEEIQQRAEAAGRPLTT